MIFAICQGVAESMTGRGFPVSVSPGPERPTAAGPGRQRHRIVISRDTSAGDAIQPPVGVRRNGERIFARMVGYTARVYAFDPSAGALNWEHEDEVDCIVDGLLVALHDWAQEGRAILAVGQGRMLTPEELRASDGSVVAGYELPFRMGRSVDRRHYDGTERATATLTGIVTVTRVSLDGETFEDVPPEVPEISEG